MSYITVQSFKLASRPSASLFFLWTWDQNVRAQSHRYLFLTVIHAISQKGGIDGEGINQDDFLSPKYPKIHSRTG
jgi:hypothetical protein